MMGWLEISIIVFVLVGVTSTITFKLLKLKGSKIYLKIKLKEFNWRFIDKVAPDPFEEVHFSPMIYGAQAGEIQFESQCFANHYKVLFEQNNLKYEAWIKISVGQFFTTVEFRDKKLAK